MKYRPLTVKIEETAFTRGLMPSIRRSEDTGIMYFREKRLNLNGLRIPVEMIKRDNETTKEERILNTLQPWYMSKQIRFLDDLGCKEQLIHELSKFPRYQYNDIIDALADQFQNREYFGRYVADSIMTADYTKNEIMEKWLKVEKFDFDKPHQESGYNIPTPEIYNPRTGGL